MKKRPNIIIFNPDEMRYDAMSHMGNPAAETPFLDEFADVLSEIAHIHSFMDMEGSFSVSFEGEHIAYDFRSEPGDGMCDFMERKEN